MPAPYSDNLYSALDDGDDDEYTQSHTDTPTANTDSNTGERDAVGNDQPDEDDALSPSDGYFHASDATAYEPTPNRQSANVPDVPNVLVDDPTLRDDDRDTKTREAENERRLSNMAALQQETPSRNSDSAHQSPPATSSRPTHSHRRSVEEDDDLAHIHDSEGQASQNPSFNHYQPQHHQQQRPSQPNLSSPLFQQQPIDAPPAYTPSAPSQSQGDTTPHSPTSTNSTGLAYQTFGSPPTTAGAPMGNPSEHSRLLGSNREPESMGGVPGDQPQTFWQRIKRAFSIRDGRERLRKFLKWTLVFVIIITIVSGFSLFGEYNMHDKPKDLEPPKEPSQPQEPEDPRKPTRPPVDGGDSDNGQHNNLAWKPRSYCHQPDSMYRLTTTIDPRFISSKKLTIVQELLKDDDPSQRQPHVEGEVVFRRSPKSNPSGEIILEILSNQRDLGEALSVRYDSSSQDLLIRTPRSVQWPHSSGPCIQMRVTVYAPENAALEYMTVNATHLNIDVMEGLDLWVQDNVHLQTVSGDIKTPKPQSGSVKDGKADLYVISKRQTIVRTVSGDIKGSFALNDLLQIESISGTVNAIITPKEVDPDAPSPAKLIISTKSGTITAEEPISNYVASVDASTSNNERSFPARDYIVDINSYSGTIQADLAFSSSASIRSQSSALKLKMLPIMDPSAKWRTARTGLTTNTKSGDTDLVLYDPIWTGILLPNDQRLIGPGDGDDDHDDKKDEDEDPWIIIHPHDTLIRTDTAADRAFGNLVSHHGSISGTMKLRYPSTWEGSVRAETISGTQKVRGEDLDIYDISTPVTRTVMGRKGKGSSELRVSTVSGSEDILIGKESS